MKKLQISKITFFTLPLLILIACSSQTPTEPTLTFHNDGCSYNGPDTVTSKFTLTWVIEESGHPGFIYALVTIDPDKTIQDLAKIPAKDPLPSWVTKFEYGYQASLGTYTESIDFSANARFREGRFFFVCFFTDGDLAMGADGPIEVKK